MARIPIAAALLAAAATVASRPHPLVAEARPHLGSGPCGNDQITYFDGTAWWLTWNGATYRGTWFNTEDFYSGPWSLNVETVEFWFYHHPSYPWDTSQFVAEVFESSQSSVWRYPTELLAAQSLTASHYEATYWEPEQLVAPADFWVIADTRQSSGGWPSLLGDNSPRDPPHSYESFPYADDPADMYNNGWSPWCPGNSDYSTDFWITCWGWPGCGSHGDFATTTWGGIKTLF